MPSVVVHMVEGRSPDEKRAVLEAVHHALMAGFGIPEDDRFQKVVEYAPENFIIPPGKSAKFLHIEIACFAGRSIDAKRKLYRAIADGLEAIGMDRMDTMIVLHEIVRENWGLRGGVPGSEIDLGFKVDV